MKKIFPLILLAGLLTPVFDASGQHSTLSDLNGVNVSNVKVPFYNKSLLQAMIFAIRAEYRAKLLYGHDVVINLLRKNSDPDKIINDWKIKIYPLGSGMKTLLDFWRPRSSYCDAVLFTPEGALNQSDRQAAGDDIVKMRSPLLDLDGIGFAADFKKQQIKINSDVKLVIRGNEFDPRQFKGKLSGRIPSIKGKADMLHLDMAGDRVLLLGNVVLEDDDYRLFCNRMTVMMNSQSSSGSGISGISSIFADGDVKLIKILPSNAAPEDRREIRGDHLIYDVKSEKIVVSGNRKNPSIISGTDFMLRGKELVFFRLKRQLIIPAECWMRLRQENTTRYLRSDYGNFDFASGICDFLDRVRGSAPQHELACEKMRVYLKRHSAENKPAPSRRNSTAISKAGDVEFGSSGIDRIICRGKVIMLRRTAAGMSVLHSSEAEMNMMTNRAEFYPDVRAESGGNTLETKHLVVNMTGKSGKMEIKNAEALGFVRIKGKAAPNGELSTILSDRGFFDYAANRIEFIDRVRASRGESQLSGDKLELFLGKRKAGSKAVSIPGMPAENSSMTLERAVVSGRAKMEEGSNTLSSDRFEYFFIPAKSGEIDQPGFFQSGSLRLSRLTGTGNVMLTNRKSREPGISAGAYDEQLAPGPGAMLGRNADFRKLSSEKMCSDFLKNTSVFTGSVVMEDDSSRLTCRKLELQAGQSKPVISVAADPDADPFDLPSENAVPSSVALGSGMELKKGIASENVVITRKESSGSTGKVICDTATFNGSDMTVCCESIPPKRPTAISSGKEHKADKFLLHLKDERLESIGDGVVQ